MMEISKEERAREGIRRQVAFFKEIGMPCCFTELGIGVLNEATIHELADAVTAGGAKTVGNFHPIGRKEAIDIYTLANH